MSKLCINFDFNKTFVNLLSCFLCVVSLVGVQRSSSSADQPEHGPSEGGEASPPDGSHQQPEALVGAGLVQGEPDRCEAAELATGAPGGFGSSCRAAAGEEEPGLGSSFNPTA